MLNENQKRALALLDKLLMLEDGKRRIKNDLAFLTSAASKPKWNEMPGVWARDWCEGWAFRPHYAHAEALGIALGNRVENKKILALWTQSTAFSFRAGYTIHSYGQEHFDKTWAEQTPHNPVLLQITDAKPAQPGGKDAKRDPGQVIFRMHRREDGYATGETRTMTQDDFVRFLIIGETP